MSEVVFAQATNRSMSNSAVMRKFVLLAQWFIRQHFVNCTSQTNSI
jgi:hypothetical protein